MQLPNLSGMDKFSFLPVQVASTYPESYQSSSVKTTGKVGFRSRHTAQESMKNDNQLQFLASVVSI
jgi:hypothetical protein